MSKAVIVQNQDRPSGARLRLKKNASDHPAAVEDDVIVFVSNPKMLSLTYRAQSVGKKLVPCAKKLVLALSSERRSTQRSQAQLSPRQTALAGPVHSQNGGGDRFELLWVSPPGKFHPAP